MESWGKKKIEVYFYPNLQATLLLRHKEAIIVDNVGIFLRTD